MKKKTAEGHLNVETTLVKLFFIYIELADKREQVSDDLELLGFAITG